MAFRTLIEELVSGAVQSPLPFLDPQSFGVEQVCTTQARLFTAQRRTENTDAPIGVYLTLRDFAVKQPCKHNHRCRMTRAAMKRCYL